MTLPADEVLLQQYACEFCHLSFTSLPNLRRHQTHAHGRSQLRTHMAVVAAYAVRGLPQCSHCNEFFLTWRNFQIHLERNCCQALTTRSTLMPGLPIPSTQTGGPYPLLTESHLTQLLSKPHGLATLGCIKARQWNMLQQMQPALTDLTNYCVICGVFSNRPQELNQHYRTQHSQLLPHVLSKASQLCRSQASNSPCRFCRRSFRRSHQCPVMTQAALLLINTDSTGQSYASPGQTALRCDVCGVQCQAIAQLQHHLSQIHRLEPQDWDPLRDMLGSGNVCSHCLACFADKASVRQHICLGQCSSFDPLRQPAELPVPPDWQAIIHQGEINELRQAPMKRLALTLRCQFCQTHFQRTGDLSLHLQTVHARLWQESQHIVQLLIASCQCHGCLCNPMTTASGLQHVCVLLRQLGMMVMKMALTLFLPWTFNRASMTTALHSLSDHAAMPQILQSILDRNFTDLWTAPQLLQVLRTRCLQCGQEMHPAELRDHVTRVHVPALYDTLLPQLLSAFGREATSDYQCDACTLIYNQPATGLELAHEYTDRQLLAQLHLKHQCPVVYQVARLLLPDGLGNPVYTAEDSEMLETFRHLGPLLKLDRYDRPDAVRAPKKAKREQHSPVTSEGDTKKILQVIGPALTQSGCRATSTQATRLLDLLHANRAPGSSTISDAEGGGMEAEAEPETADRPAPGSQLHAAEMLPHTAPAKDLSGQTPQIGPVQRDGSAEGRSPATWSADPGERLSFSEMESTNIRPEDNLSASNHAPTHGQIR